MALAAAPLSHASFNLIVGDKILEGVDVDSFQVAGSSLSLILSDDSAALLAETGGGNPDDELEARREIVRDLYSQLLKVTRDDPAGIEWWVTDGWSDDLLLLRDRFALGLLANEASNVVDDWESVAFDWLDLGGGGGPGNGGPDEGCDAAGISCAFPILQSPSSKQQVLLTKSLVIASKIVMPEDEAVLAGVAIDGETGVTLDVWFSTTPGGPRFLKNGSRIKACNSVSQEPRKDNEGNYVRDGSGHVVDVKAMSFAGGASIRWRNGSTDYDSSYAACVVDPNQDLYINQRVAEWSSRSSVWIDRTAERLSPPK